MALHRGALLGLLGVGLALIVAGCGGEVAEGPGPVTEWDLSGTDVGQIDFPEGIGIAKDGSILVVDTWNDRILQLDQDGTPVRAFGTFGYEEGELQSPRSVTTDQAGNIYVVDAWNQRIQKFSPDGKFLLTVGGRGAPWGYDEADGKFIFPYGVAVDSRGYIFVSDFNNNRMHMFDPKGEFVMKWGTKGRQDGQLSKPSGLAIDSQDRLYVADFGNSRVQRFVILERDEGFEPKFDGKWGAEEFDRPYDVSVDPDDNFYVADMGSHSVYKFSPSGHPEWVHTFEVGEDGRPAMPVAVAAAGGDVVYVCDLGRNRITKLAPSS